MEDTSGDLEMGPSGRSEVTIVVEVGTSSKALSLVESDEDNHVEDSKEEVEEVQESST
jgi:hypothetical protein